MHYDTWLLSMINVYSLQVNKSGHKITPRASRLKKNPFLMLLVNSSRTSCFRSCYGSSYVK